MRFNQRIPGLGTVTLRIEDDGTVSLHWYKRWPTGDQSEAAWLLVGPGRGPTGFHLSLGDLYDPGVRFGASLFGLGFGLGWLGALAQPEATRSWAELDGWRFGWSLGRPDRIPNGAVWEREGGVDFADVLFGPARRVALREAEPKARMVLLPEGPYNVLVRVRWHVVRRPRWPFDWQRYPSVALRVEDERGIPTGPRGFLRAETVSGAVASVDEALGRMVDGVLSERPAGYSPRRRTLAGALPTTRHGRRARAKGPGVKKKARAR